MSVIVVIVKPGAGDSFIVARQKAIFGVMLIFRFYGIIRSNFFILDYPL